jgi:hypothetical protein
MVCLETLKRKWKGRIFRLIDFEAKVETLVNRLLVWNWKAKV